MFEEFNEVLNLANNAIEFIDNVKKITNIKKNKKKDYAQIGSSGDSAQIGSSGDYAQIGSSGDYAQIGSSGDYAQIGSSGDSAQIGSSGYYAQIGSSGDYAKIGSSGYYAQIGSSGYYAQIGSSGDYAKIGSSGYYAQIGSSGDSAQIGSSGYYAQIGSSGYYAKIKCSGKNSILSAIGLYSTATAKIGNWITLAEFKKETDKIIVDFVKTEFVDGDKIKEDIRYCLYNHKFSEVVCFDEIDAIVLSKKKNVYKVVTFSDYFTKKESFIVTDGLNYSHGETIKQAKADLIYKISNRDTSQFDNLNLESVLSKEDAIKMYRIITGACEFGTKQFVGSLKKIKKEYSVKEIIDLTSGQFGNEKLRQFFKDK